MSSHPDEDAAHTGRDVTTVLTLRDLAGSNAEPPTRVEDLLAKCKSLLAELETFSGYLSDARNGATSGVAEPVVEIRQFYTPIVAELKSLQKLSEGDQKAEKTIHTLRSSNLPFYTAIWEAAKASTALLLFHKRFHWDVNPTRDSKKVTQRRSALVDIVACDGEEWIKVSTVTEQRLIFELAKAQWEEADSSDDDGEENSPSRNEEDASADHVERMDLVRTADDLQRAAQKHRIRYSNPRIRIVLPKISDPPPPQLSLLLDRLRSTGAILELGPQTMHTNSTEALRETIFPRLLPSPHPPLTDTLNVDCTILLALVSDLSHKAEHPVLPSYNDAIKRQIELETQEHLLPSGLWPAMANKVLVCTVEAARRMREIVDTIGTPGERARTELLLGTDIPGQESPRSGEELRAAFTALSDYTVPPTFLIPIKIVSSIHHSELEVAIASSQIPPVARTIEDQLTEINRSVFLYGWVKGVTTVSSNRVVAKWIESTVEKAGNGAVGPEIWLREPARSLLGKEKERRK